MKTKKWIKIKNGRAYLHVKSPMEYLGKGIFSLAIHPLGGDTKKVERFIKKFAKIA